MTSPLILGDAALAAGRLELSAAQLSALNGAN